MGSKKCLPICGGFGIVTILIVVFLLPALPGRPGEAENRLTELVHTWDGRVVVHSGLVRAMHLAGSNIRDNDVVLLTDAIADLKSPEALREIDLSNTKIGDGACEALEGLRENRFQLYLNNTPITDRGLAALARGCAGLAVLQIENTQVTEAGLLQLKNHQTLQEVYVSGPRITPDVVGRLNKDNDKHGGISFKLSGTREMQ